MLKHVSLILMSLSVTSAFAAGLPTNTPLKDLKPNVYAGRHRAASLGANGMTVTRDLKQSAYSDVLVTGKKCQLLGQMALRIEHTYFSGETYDLTLAPSVSGDEIRVSGQGPDGVIADLTVKCSVANITVGEVESDLNSAIQFY